VVAMSQGQPTSKRSKNFFFTSSVMRSIQERGTPVCCVKSLGRLLRGPGNSRRASFWIVRLLALKMINWRLTIGA